MGVRGLIACVLFVRVALWWGFAVRACSVTVVIFIMNFGLVVDYSAHIAHHFMTHRGTPRDRAANALKEMGSSVFNGAFTTALGMLPLIWAPFQTGACAARLSVWLSLCLSRACGRVAIC